jgi:NADH-quinone oxidoreductase subunit C
MSAKLEQLAQQLTDAFGDKISDVAIGAGEVQLDVSSMDYLAVMVALRDGTEFSFEQLIDLAGIDYSAFHGWTGKRFAAVTHLLSIKHNRRLRVRAFADDEFPVLPSVTQIWNSANWFEREAFDLFGIHFDGHDDLRRILTDYGFIGHPFRKDFPISGYVEMIYDPEQRRVVYQPVTIEPREVTPRIVREDPYGKVGGRG